MAAGSVLKVAVTAMRGAVAVISCVTGFSTVWRLAALGPALSTSASVAPSSQLGQFWLAPGVPR